MHIHVLFAQRHESYPGQFEPEILASLTEDQLRRDPQFFDRILEKEDVHGAYAEVRVLKLDVNGILVRQLLKPAPESLSASINLSLD